MEQSDNRRWKVLKSEYLSKEPWLTVRREHVELPNGNQIKDYYIHEYPGWVNVIAITKDKKFVMVKQYRHGLGITAFELSAGVAEDYDPAPVVSAQRELLEETGYGKGVWKEYMQISPNASTNTNTVYCFLATDVEMISEQDLEPSEDLTVHLLSLDEVKQLLINDEIKQSTQVAPLWKYMAENHLM